MRYANVTAVQIGMTGKFADKTYRVAGRIVMSMEEAGETYWWNEFHLVADDGSCATLVHEETERGFEWRIFTLFEPTHPMTVVEATTKRVGDTINVTDKTLRVTCVDESRVCQIEGEAPEGVENGDVARYFNAESGYDMIVVSWTGDEIEFYRGITLPAHVVMSAFGITSVPQGALQHLSGDAVPDASKSIKGIIGVVAMILAIATGWYWFSTRDKSSEAPKLPKPQLSIGQTSDLNGTRYRVAGRAVVEISHVGKRYLCHEYSVVDEAGTEVLFVQGNESGSDRWTLMTPFAPPSAFTPREAGAQRLGSLVMLDNAAMKVSELFLSRAQAVEGMTRWAAGTELYGLMARGANQTLVARWNETNVAFYRATPVAEKTIVKGFAAK